MVATAVIPEQRHASDVPQNMRLETRAVYHHAQAKAALDALETFEDDMRQLAEDGAQTYPNVNEHLMTAIEDEAAFLAAFVTEEAANLRLMLLAECSELVDLAGLAERRLEAQARRSRARALRPALNTLETGGDDA